MTTPNHTVEIHLAAPHGVHVADRCNISGEFSCDPCCEIEEWAPCYVTPRGAIICGCTSCCQVRWDDYGCAHAIDAGCTCVEDTLDPR